MRWLPQGTFARTVMLIAVVMTVNLAATYLIVTLYVVRPSIQQLSYLLGHQVQTTQLLEQEAAQQGTPMLDAYLELSNIREHTPVAAAERGLDNAMHYRFLSAYISEVLEEPAEVRVSSSGQFTVWVRPESRVNWLEVPLATFTEGQFSPLVFYLLLIGLLSLGGAALIASWLNRPLKQLERAAQTIGHGSYPGELSPDGTREIQAVTRAFNKMTRSIDRMESDRALLLAGISHDLRTPLSRLRLAVEMLSAEQAQDPMTESIVQDIDDIDAIIGQFTEFARAREPAQFSRADLNSIIEQVVHSYQAEAPDDIHLELADLPLVQLHPVAIKRVLYNLLSNALRYGKPPVRVASGYWPKAAQVWFEVQDAGPGIAREQQTDMFEPFTQGDSARGGEGSGLGLAIVKRFTNLHRGELYVGSQVGAQTGFRIRIILPLSQSRPDSDSHD